MSSEYIAKTQLMVTFLTGCLSPVLGLQAIVAQAEGNTEKLIDLLELVKCQCEEWIKELKTIKD